MAQIGQAGRRRCLWGARGKGIPNGIESDQNRPHVEAEVHVGRQQEDTNSLSTAS